jgi:hypothetical protein
MAVASPPERLRSDLSRLVHRGAGVREFSLAAARVLARAVPFDGVCVLTMDPATRLPTGEVVDNGLPAAASARMTEIELGGEDFNAFGALARSGRRAATLSEATAATSTAACATASSDGHGDSATSYGPHSTATRRRGAPSRFCAPPIEGISRRATRRSSRP